jgi:outer membrane protein assembly factor BamB
MKKILLALLSLSLTACSIFTPYGTSNIPEPAIVAKITPEVAPKLLWQTNAGNGSDGAYLRLTPTVAAGVIYTIDQSGMLVATDARGIRLWQLQINGGGKSNLASDGRFITFVDNKGVLYLLSVDHGKKVWQANLVDQALAAPTITPNLIIVKTIDGAVTAFDRSSGQQRWQYQHDVPDLTLRASSSAVVIGQIAYVGFADGQVVALNIANGDQLWSQQAAEPQGFSDIERLVDIDANLIIDGNRLYVATYQGQIAALDLHNGKIIWQRPNSVYADIASDHHALYAVNNDGSLTAYNLINGDILWQQKALAWHFLTGPTIYENNLVVGDVQGQLYFIKPSNGDIIGNLAVYKDSNIINAPLQLGNLLIVINTHGRLAAVL